MSPRCLEGLEATDLWQVLLYAKMFTLDVSLEVLSDIMGGLQMEKAVIDQSLSLTEGVGPVSSATTMVRLEHLAEEPLGGVEIAVRGQQDIYLPVSILVDGSVQLSAICRGSWPRSHQSGPSRTGTPKLPQPFFDHRA